MDYQIVTRVISKYGRAPWISFDVYASPRWCFRQELWRYLVMLGEVIQFSWLVMGDFNQIMYTDEKKWGHSSPIGPMSMSIHMIQECAMIDLGYSGPMFT